MDRRSLIAIVAAIAFYYLWLMWVQSTQPPAEPEPVAPITSVTPDRAPAPAPAAPVMVGPERTVALEWCDVTTQWSNRTGGMSGGAVTAYTAPYAVTPWWMWGISLVTDGVTSWVPYGEDTGPAAPLPPGSAGVVAGSGPVGRALAPAELSQSGGGVALRRVTAEGLEVRTEVQPGAGCFADVTITWTNGGSSPYTGPLWLGTYGDLPEETSRYHKSPRPLLSVDEDVEELTDLEDLDGVTEFESLEGHADFLGVADTYFGTFLLPSAASEGRAGFSTIPGPSGPMHGVHHVVERTLAPGASHTETLRLYAGPLSFSRLGEVDASLEGAIQLGFFGFFGRILLWLLEALHGVVGNWGLSIIGLTLLVKGVFFPLTQMSFRSSQAMQAVQPLVLEIKAKYENDPEELNRQMIKLWRENGVNPAGGCIPMLVQLPVWLALYQVLLTSVDLYHTKFLYLDDLSAPDPYGVLPLMAVVLMVAQQQMMPVPNMDPTQAKILKIMPIAFGLLFFTFPSGLVVYIFVNTVLTMVQQWLIKRSFGARTATQGSAT